MAENTETNYSKPDSNRKLRVGITYNQKRNIITEPPDAEAEFDDIETILAIKNALEAGNCEVELYEATENLPEKLIKQKPEIVFNIAEGKSGGGREAKVPAILNYLGIPYTGSDETTMCIAMDKALTKRLLTTYQIRTPKYKVAGIGTPITTVGLTYPLIVKPNAEGSGKGISGVSIVTNIEDLRKTIKENTETYKQDALVEEYIPGREFTVGILGNGDDTRVFPPMEIIFRDKSKSIYSYAVKKNFRKYVDYACPPDITSKIREHIENTAHRIYRILKCRDCARMDFRLSPEGRLYFIEINPLPGLAPGYSDFPILAEYCGVGYDALVQGILESALKRYSLK